MSRQNAIIDVPIHLPIVAELFLIMVWLLALVLFLPHSFQVQHLDHLIWDFLFLVELVLSGFGEGFWHDCYSVGVQATIQTALHYLTVLYRVLFEDLVNVLWGGLDTQTL